MNELKGIPIKKMYHEQLEYVGTLLFNEYPSTIVYKNENNEPIIKEWVDCSDDNKIDRFFYYSVKKIGLKNFLEGNLSHLELINSSIEDFVYFQDENENKIINTLIVSIGLIPYNYLPANDFMFNTNDGVDTQKIINNFDLDYIKIQNEIIPFVVKEAALKAHSETIYIHLENGKGIGHGTIKTEVLGKTLLSIDKLYKSIALDYLKGKNRGDIRLEAEKNSEYLKFIDTEVYGKAVAASYGFLLRPIYSLIDQFTSSPASVIASMTLNLINKSKNTEELKGEFLGYSPMTIKTFEDFLSDIYKQELKMDLTWFNPVTNVEVSSTMDYINANKIVLDIKQLEITSRNEFKVNGKFRAIDCDTAHFIFISTDGGKYNGYFEKLIEDSINRINFIDVYEISIRREIFKKAGTKETKNDVIISYYLPQ